MKTFRNCSPKSNARHFTQPPKLSPTKTQDSDDELDDAAVAAVADAAEWGADDATIAAIADGALEAKEWEGDFDEATAAIIAAAEVRRSQSATVRMAVAADPSRSPPTRRGPFQDRPPIPKPLPQPVASTSTPPARSSPLTLTEAQAIGPWMTWTLFPDACLRTPVRLTPRPLPNEELSPPPLPYYSRLSSKALGKRKLPPTE